MSTARLALASAWMSAHKNWDISAIEGHFTRCPNFIYSYLPVSAGIPSKSLQKWREYAVQMKAILPDFEVTVLDMYESYETVVARIIGRATSRTGARFEQEYIMLLHMRFDMEGGTKNVQGRTNSGVLKLFKVEEFIDTKFANGFFVAERARLSERGYSMVGGIKIIDQGDKNGSGRRTVDKAQL